MLANQAAPKVTITSPKANSVFPQDLGVANTVFTATATDADTADAQLQFSWEIRLIHVK